MKTSLIASLTAALLLAGCATQTKEQLAEARAAGLSPDLLRKLERSGRLSPEDIIELKRRRVNDGIALRQLDRAGVDYVVDKDVTKKLRKAGVSETVITAATNAGKSFEDQFRRPYVSAWVGSYGYPYGHPYGYGYPLGYGYGYPYGYPYGYSSIRTYPVHPQNLPRRSFNHLAGPRPLRR